MKRVFLLLAAAALLGACSPDAEGIDDTPQQEEPGEPGKEPSEPSEPPTSEAAKRLETLCEQLNGDLTTLYTLIAADELPDCVVNVAPIAPAGETIGYGLAFKQNGAVTLYFDPDAEAQESVPQFGVYEADGARYWSMNGQPLPSATGAPVPVVNDEGIVPRLKAEKGYWHISVDGGKSWWPAGQAPDGTTELATMPLVSQVAEEAEAWNIVLADGETALSIPKEGTLHIAVDAEEPLKFQPHEIHTVKYTVTGGSSKTVVTAELEEPDGSYTLQVTPTDAASGSVAITAQVLYDKNILIIATDGTRTATTTVAVTFRPGIDNTNITVETPGTLAELLAEFNQETITELTIEGNLNSADFKTLRNLPNLAVLDMESVDLKTLPDYAFYNSKKTSSLTIVRLPKVLENLGTQPFRECSNLTDVTIPQGVKFIDSYTFYSCSSLTRVIIPQNVTWIGEVAFCGCRSLTSVTIPNSVMWISESAFVNCSSLTSITIPDSVTTIKDSAFSGCSSLTSITIGNSVTSIGIYAFRNCSSLTSVTIPNSVTSIGISVFSYCSSLTSITIPDSVTSIEFNAFGNCSGLTSITISDSVTSIGNSAFSGCSSLTSITIPDSVTSIEANAFYGCSNLTSVTIPDSVTTIGSSAFFGCRSLTSVTIPDGVTSIGAKAFSSCYSLTSIYCKAQTPPTIDSSTLDSSFYGWKQCTLYIPTGCKEAYAAADYWKNAKEIIEMEF